MTATYARRFVPRLKDGKICMTKYVLNSGGLNNNIPGARRFIAELLKGLGENPQILFCFFAEKREDWEEKFPKFKQGFNNWAPSGVNATFELAFPETFVAQVSSSDVIYLYGGDDFLLQYWLTQFDLARIWDGKVVGTISASSDALSEYFWPCDWRECKQGLGILPIKFIPHYKSNFGKDDPRGPVDWESAYRELEEYGDSDLPIFALKEGEFKVFEV